MAAGQPAGVIRVRPGHAADARSVLDAAIAVTGLFVGHGSGFLGLLAAGPLLACARCDGLATALVAAYAVVLCAVAALTIGTPGAALGSYRFIMVVVSGVVAVFVAEIRSRREGALMSINDQVQRAILRPLPAECGGMAFASHYQSATRQALVGGDLYDIAMTQYGPRFIIGDVKGKGLDAVGRYATVLAEPDLDAAVRRLVRLLRQHAGRKLADDVLLVLGEPVQP